MLEIWHPVHHLEFDFATLKSLRGRNRSSVSKYTILNEMHIGDLLPFIFRYTSVAANARTAPNSMFLIMASGLLRVGLETKFA